MTDDNEKTDIRKMIIRKHGTSEKKLANFSDYEGAAPRFKWEEARQSLVGLPANRGINIAYEALDYHLAAGGADKIAIRWCSSRRGVREISYRELADQSSAFANVLRSHGVNSGDGVFTLLGRVPELYVTCFGALKNKSVFCPLFSAFGPNPLRMRLDLGQAKVLVTTERLYERKIAGLRGNLPQLKHVFLVSTLSTAGRPIEIEGTHDFQGLLASASTTFEIPATSPEDLALLHFTSGTTGTPKGALHVHDAVLYHKETGRIVLDMRPDDVFWCTADPGWVTGTSYGIVAPLANGVTLVLDESEFDPERWYTILEQQRVTVWYTAPTAIRMLMKAGDDLPKRFDLSALRHIASVGEPLNPEAVLWGQRVLGLPIHDNWWQTETGGIMIANFPAMDIKPGSMGRPVPGIQAAIVQIRQGHATSIDSPDVEGELAIKTPWPSMFRGYLGEENRYRKCFSDGWYLTGDLARRDADGYFWFVGRADDVIKSSGHLIGPFEVESILMEHPGVAEVGVIGKPDPLLGELVKAFVSLKTGLRPSEKLRKDLLALARRRLGATIAPREISFLESLPKTRSGKVMRRLLKARELGLPEGDLSTLEGASETPLSL